MGRPRRESGESEPGTHEVTGTRSSFGWQISVGRIARLSHREVARPVGARRALAGKKSSAPSDAGRGWADGESVRVFRISKQVFLCTACGLIACRRSIRWKAFSGLCPSCSHRQAEAGPSDSQVNSASPSARSVMTESTSGGTDSDSGVPAGDNGDVRGRHDSVKALQGPRRSAESPHPRR